MSDCVVTYLGIITSDICVSKRFVAAGQWYLATRLVGGTTDPITKITAGLPRHSGNETVRAGRLLSESLFEMKMIP